jgi:hypothetical protein
MAIDKEQIKQLLGSGLSNEIVASAVGCDSSYIGQLVSDEHFAAEVAALRVKNLQATNARDRNIDSIEDRLLDKVSELVDQNMFYKPNDVLRAAVAVNAMKRRGVPATESVTVNNTVVQLQLPKVIVQNFTINTQGEVIEVEGQTLVTKSAHTLLGELADRGSDGARYEKVRRYLPTAIDGTPNRDRSAEEG